jgi:hypothetical protein
MHNKEYAAEGGHVELIIFMVWMGSKT